MKTIINGIKLGTEVAIAFVTFTVVTKVIGMVSKAVNEKIGEKLEKTEEKLEKKLNSVEEGRTFESMGEFIRFLHEDDPNDDDLK